MVYQTFMGALALALAGLAAAAQVNWDMTNLIDPAQLIIFNGGIDGGVHANAGPIVGLHNFTMLGGVGVKAKPNFPVNPALHLDLSGLEFDMTVEVASSDGVGETTIQLGNSEELNLDVNLLLVEVDIDVQFALELVVKVTAKTHVRTGVKVSFGDAAWLTVNLVESVIQNSELGLLVATARAIELATGVRVDYDVVVDISLRLRTTAGIKGDLPLLGDVGAGVAVGLWLNIARFRVEMSSNGAVFGMGAVPLGSKGDCGFYERADFAVQAAVVVELDVDAGHLGDHDFLTGAYVNLATFLTIDPGCELARNLSNVDHLQPPASTPTLSTLNSTATPTLSNNSSHWRPVSTSTGGVAAGLPGPSAAAPSRNPQIPHADSVPTGTSPPHSPAPAPTAGGVAGGLPGPSAAAPAPDHQIAHADSVPTASSPPHNPDPAPTDVAGEGIPGHVDVGSHGPSSGGADGTGSGSHGPSASQSPCSPSSSHSLPTSTSAGGVGGGYASTTSMITGGVPGVAGATGSYTNTPRPTSTLSVTAGAPVNPVDNRLALVLIASVVALVL